MSSVDDILVTDQLIKQSREEIERAKAKLVDQKFDISTSPLSNCSRPWIHVLS